MNMYNNPVFIIAEAGVNHNGSLEIAKKLIDAAVTAGADAVKFQTFKADKTISVYAPKAEYQKKTTEVGESQLDMVRKLELNAKQHKELVNYCDQQGIEFMSTPFDLDSVDFLVNELNVKCIKISSGDITNAPLLLQAARTGKDIILSTGMSTLGEIEQALGVLAFGFLNNDETPTISRFREAYYSQKGRNRLKQKVTLLHCTTEYPAPFEEVNLKVMDTMKLAFNLTTGYSDHTNGIAVPIAAVARGAEVIEKHFTLDKNMEGPDHKASLEPHELKAMVLSIRQVEKALGSAVKIPTESEYKNINVARKSLVANKDIIKCEKFNAENVTFKRPGNGISPYHYWEIVREQAKKDYKKDELI